MGRAAPLVVPDLIEDRLGALFVLRVQGGEERVVTFAGVGVGHGDLLEGGAYGAEGAPIGAAVDEVFGASHAVEGAANGHRPDLAARLKPVPRARRVALGHHAIERRPEDGLGDLRLTHREGEGEIAVVEETQGLSGLVVLDHARPGDAAESDEEKREPEEDPRRDREPRGGTPLLGHVTHE